MISIKINVNCINVSDKNVIGLVKPTTMSFNPLINPQEHIIPTTNSNFEICPITLSYSCLSVKWQYTKKFLTIKLWLQIIFLGMGFCLSPNYAIKTLLHTFYIHGVF